MEVTYRLTLSRLTRRTLMRLKERLKMSSAFWPSKLILQSSRLAVTTQSDVSLAMFCSKDIIFCYKNGSTPVHDDCDTKLLTQQQYYTTATTFLPQLITEDVSVYCSLSTTVIQCEQKYNTCKMLQNMKQIHYFLPFHCMEQGVLMDRLFWDIRSWICDVTERLS